MAFRGGFVPRVSPIFARTPPVRRKRSSGRRSSAEARKHAGLTQKDLAADMGVSIARISQIEHGEVTSVEQLAEVDGDPPRQSHR